MQPKRQHGWLYLVGATPEAAPNDGDKEGWYKIEKVAKFKGHKVTDNRTCVKQGCPCKKKHTPIRNKRGMNKARGQRKHGGTTSYDE